MGNTFNLPEPIFLELKSLGNITTSTRNNVIPSFPAIPTARVATIPGLLGVVSIENHNVYEELPVIGPTIEALRQCSATKARNTYASVFAPANTTALTNLQRFVDLPTCKSEMISQLENLGVRHDRQFDTIRDTGINFKILNSISKYLGETETFKYIKSTRSQCRKLAL